MNATLPKVSIVTPVYNGAQYIEKLIQSVLKQSYPNIEHIIIDDGSQDDGATSRVLKKYPHLRCWERENRGQYATMNEGLDAASGDWICFISADDLVAPNAVSKVVDVITDHQGLDGVFGKARYIYEDESEYPVQAVFPGKPALYKYLSQIPHCSVYMRREYLVEHKLRFDETIKFNGDYDWFLSVLENSPNLYGIRTNLSLIRQHQGQISRVKIDEISNEREQVQKKHNINILVYRLCSFCLTLRHAILRIRYQFLRNGFRAGLSLIWYFICHKLGMDKVSS
jgi:glycosyltransferase involved in cell wall biosynthesis